MIVTIMSDASLCPDTGASGYGIWIKSNRGSFQGSGKYKKPTTCISELEAMALANALFVAFHAGIAKDGDSLILQTDSLYTVEAVNHRYHAGNRHLRPLAKILRDKAKKHGCPLELRHVKAHAPHIASRNYINNVCDTLAKKVMREERARIRAA